MKKCKKILKMGIENEKSLWYSMDVQNKRQSKGAIHVNE